MLRETRSSIENIGWTLGNECPFRCTHCYSMAARVKGKDLTRGNIDRIVDQLAINGIKTINLGGNEPLYTNGSNPRDTLLPYIITQIKNRGMIVGLTTAGVTLTYLAEHHPDEFRMLNDVDVSLDSPFEDEHNRNRGAKLFRVAIRALEICQEAKIEHGVVTCGMSWNLSLDHVRALVDIAKRTGGNVRINFLKPTEPEHWRSFPTVTQFYDTARELFRLCRPVDLGEPLISTALTGRGKGCPCGVKSFRIHSITPDGQVPVSPCVYMHDYRVGDLLRDELADIVNSEQFRAFRQRHANPSQISGCSGCQHLESCRGGCAARAYFMAKNHDLYERDPYCVREHAHAAHGFPFDPSNVVNDGGGKTLVHQDYLCTYILEPR